LSRPKWKTRTTRLRPSRSRTLSSHGSASPLGLSSAFSRRSTPPSRDTSDPGVLSKSPSGRSLLRRTREATEHYDVSDTAGRASRSERSGVLSARKRQWPVVHAPDLERPQGLSPAPWVVVDTVALAATIGGSLVALAGVGATAWGIKQQRESAKELEDSRQTHERLLAS